MNQGNLIAALQEECRTDRLKVEDFLKALADLCAEALERGEPFYLGEMGSLAINPSVSRSGKGIRAAIFFKASKAFRKRLRIPEEAVKRSSADTCKTCGIRPNKVRVYDGCHACIEARKKRGEKTRITGT